MLFYKITQFIKKKRIKTYSKMPSQSLKRKTMTVGFHDLNPTVQQEIAKKCGFSSPFDLAQGVFKAKLSFTWDIEFPMKEKDLDDLVSMMSDVSVDETPVPQPPKKKIIIKKKVNTAPQQMVDDTIDDTYVNLDDEEYDEKYPEGKCFKYGSQTLWLSFADKKIDEIVEPSQYAALVPHPYLKHCNEIKSSLLIKKKDKDGSSTTISNMVVLNGKIKAEYLDESTKMLVLTIPESLKENDDFNYMMNILAKAFAFEVPKNRKIFFGRMDDDNLGSGKWGMPNSSNMCHMLEKFGFELV